MRGCLLTAGSIVLTALVIGNAYYQRQQFYPSIVYITKSNPSLAVSIGNKVLEKLALTSIVNIYFQVLLYVIIKYKVSLFSCLLTWKLLEYIYILNYN